MKRICKICGRLVQYRLDPFCTSHFDAMTCNDKCRVRGDLQDLLLKQHPAEDARHREVQMCIRCTSGKRFSIATWTSLECSIKPDYQRFHHPAKKNLPRLQLGSPDRRWRRIHSKGTTKRATMQLTTRGENQRINIIMEMYPGANAGNGNG